MQEEVQQILHVAISPSFLEISNLLTYSGWNGTKLKFAVEVQHLQALKQNFMSGLLLLVVNYVKLYLTILFKIPTGILRLCGQKGKNKRNQGLLFWTSKPWCRDSIFNQYCISNLGFYLSSFCKRLSIDCWQVTA